MSLMRRRLDSRGLGVDLGALLLIAFLVPVTLGTHAFCRLSGHDARNRDRVEFNGNVALLSGLIVLFAVTDLQHETPYGLSAPLFATW
jgi:putative oxidoreductase